VIIVVPSVRGDSLVSAVAIACREIYRVVKGGKPEPRWISAASMKEENERYLSAGDRIFVTDDREGKLLGARDLLIKSWEKAIGVSKENRRRN
jgi:hypothetical protein